MYACCVARNSANLIGNVENLDVPNFVRLRCSLCDSWAFETKVTHFHSNIANFMLITTVISWICRASVHVYLNEIKSYIGRNTNTRFLAYNFVYNWDFVILQYKQLWQAYSEDACTLAHSEYAWHLTFAKELHELKLNSIDAVMATFDEKSLLTNILLDKMINMIIIDKCFANVTHYHFISRDQFKNP